jgi:hypothetical protein
MKRLILASAMVVVSSVVAFWSEAHAQSNTNAGHLKMCRAASGETDFFYCSLYTWGLLDGYYLRGGPEICVPNNIMQQNTVVAAYLENNAARWDEPRPVLVIEALREAFPCP